MELNTWTRLLSSLTSLLDHDSELVDQILTYVDEETETPGMEAEHNIVIETVLGLLSEQTCPWVKKRTHQST